MKGAMLYSKEKNKEVNCYLCNHHCKILSGKRGICGVRENRNGKLYSLVYGKAIASHIDPIEKKPFFHFLPGTNSFSIATVGCNFHCWHCQNYDISQFSGKEVPGKELLPEEIVKLTQENSCESIAYTYTEPTIFFEYAHDTSKIAQKKGLKNLFVTNGFMTDEALKKINPYLDAANVDLKSFSDKFYREICGARLNPILESLKLMKKLGIWVEVTTLIIPTLNDSTQELKQIAEFIKNELGRGTPWHISRFHPDYKLSHLPSTPLETIHQAGKVGKEVGLRYVYTGNVPGDSGENTYCYNCGELLIRRQLFTVLENKIKNKRCPNCGVKIEGVFQV